MIIDTRSLGLPDVIVEALETILAATTDTPPGAEPPSDSEVLEQVALARVVAVQRLTGYLQALAISAHAELQDSIATELGALAGPDPSPSRAAKAVAEGHRVANAEIVTATGLALHEVQRRSRLAASPREFLGALLSALTHGRTTLERATAVRDDTAALPDQAAERVLDRVLAPKHGHAPDDLSPEATLSHARFLRRLRERVVHETARVRTAEEERTRRLEERDVWSRVDDHGVAQLGLSGHPDQVAAAKGRIDQLARAAKQGGDSRRLAQLRADIALALLTHGTTATQPGAGDVNLPETRELLPPTPSAPAPQGTGRPWAPGAGGGDLGTGAAGSAPDVDAPAGSSDPDVTPAAPDPWVHPDPGSPFADLILRDHEEQVASERRQQEELAAADSERARAAQAAAEQIARTAAALADLRAPAHVDVRVDLLTLLGLRDDPGHLDGIGPIPAETAREIALRTDSRWHRLVHDPVTGILYDRRTVSYHPTPTMRDDVVARDLTCRAPGCTRPAQVCDLDHVTPYPTGPTSPANLVALCRYHHQLKTRGHWDYRLDGEGRLHVTTRTGQRLEGGAHEHRDADPADRAAAEVRPAPGLDEWSGGEGPRGSLPGLLVPDLATWRHLDLDKVRALRARGFIVVLTLAA